MNRYDRLIKENFFTELLPVIEFLLGLPSIKNTIAITGKLQHTLEKEPDYARIVELENGEKFILHVEFQVKDEKNMIYRMRHYHNLLSTKYPGMMIKPFVVYLGNKKPTMRTSLTLSEMFTHFDLKNLNDYSAQKLTQKDIPEAVLLAILANYEGEKPAVVIRAIIEKLTKISADQTKLKRYITQLAGLSGLRNLEQDVTQQFKAMALDFEIENNFLFKEGKQEGKQETQEEIITSILRKSKMSVREIAQLLDVPEKLVRALKKKLKQ